MFFLSNSKDNESTGKTSIAPIQEEPMVGQLHPLVIDEDIVIYDICR